MVLMDGARTFEVDLDSIIKNSTAKSGLQKTDQSLDWFDFVIKYKIGV